MKTRFIMLRFENKNERQSQFNQLKGVIEELNDAEKFCSITLRVGHENFRAVNFSLRKSDFDKALLSNNLGDKVVIRYYLTSNYNQKNSRWYTTATVLDISKVND